MGYLLHIVHGMVLLNRSHLRFQFHALVLKHSVFYSDLIHKALKILHGLSVLILPLFSNLLLADYH